jgi:hypothetical protein
MFNWAGLTDRGAEAAENISYCLDFLYGKNQQILKPLRSLRLGGELSFRFFASNLQPPTAVGPYPFSFNL